MNKLYLVVAAIFVSLSAFAGEVTVKWQEPENYTDIRAGEQNKDKFQANLFNSFDAIFADLAKKLPDGTHWWVTITDLDLAGEVKPLPHSAGRQVRVIKRNDRPAIVFQSTLMDANNKVISDEKVDIKDTGFLPGSETMVDNDSKSFPHEERMIRRWFEEQQSKKALPSR